MTVLLYFKELNRSEMRLLSKRAVKCRTTCITAYLYLIDYNIYGNGLLPCLCMNTGLEKNLLGAASG